MASFSFGAGNARKLAALPLYAAGRLVTAVIPRSRDEWVVGCGAGIGDGALALWETAIQREGHRGLWLVSNAREATDAAARGIPFAYKNSLRGFWRTTRARVVVVTHGFGDVNRYAVSGAFIVQLWHGIPLKRIGLDSPETLRLPSVIGRLPVAGILRRLLSGMYAVAARRIRVLPAASDLVRGRLESAFSLPSECVPVSGEPRVDVLSRGTLLARRSAARAEVDRIAGPVDPASRLVLYAPTWRDGEIDPAIPNPQEWFALIEVLTRHDAVILVRSHPLGAGNYVPPVPTERVRPLGSDLISDITPVLPGLEAVITDYSSLAFDAGLVPLPVVYFAPDLEAYERRRGFYGQYVDVAGNDHARNWNDATSHLDAVLSDDDARAEATARSRALSDRLHAHRDGHNTDRVYRAILRGLGARAMSPAEAVSEGER
ncbi:CDP-glycerol glycerophosphotransferase family protein [Microbacterium lacus]|uniref:CDP-glycerol glycerophosphotransferase family protein n=1 Tax=Microbacterium lacus TaxID=415217 RepID=UPI003850F455